MSDIRSVSRSSGGASDEYVEQLRQKIGTGFSDQKASGKKRNEMGKDDFVKLMSAQLKHQDPLSPLKNEQMAAQLAQFSALEQMVNMNSNLEKMAEAQKPGDNVLAASLIGKKIMTDSSRFSFQKGAQPEVKFELPSDAASVSVSLVDSKGEIIREYDLGTMSKGAQSLRWDGKNSKSLEVQPGDYSYKVTAQDPEGKPMQIRTSTAGMVTGVSFEGGKALLMVDGKKIPLEAVGQIEADIPQAPAANALTAAKAGGGENPLAEKTTQQAKNSLPNALDQEKIKSMLGSLGSSARKDEGADKASGENGEGQLPMPLWNPASL